MRLEGILGKDLEDLGLELEEERSLLHLKYNGGTVATWYAIGADIEDVKKTAQGWVESLRNAPEGIRQ